MPRKIISNWSSLFFASVVLTFSHALVADDVIESINEGLEAYKEGALKDAVESLNYASQLIQQMKGENLQTFLPEPLEGWEAQQASSQSAGAGMFGGGITAERSYRKGNSRINVNIITDSPMIQGMMMMFSNPMFASSEGGKLKKIKRHKAMVKYDPNNQSGEIKIMAADRIMVNIDGSKVTEADLMEYAKAIDYKKLSNNF